MAVTRPVGFRAAAAAAGIKPSGKTDLALIVCDPTSDAGRASSAAVMTSNVVVGAPLQIARRWRASLAHGGRPLRAVLVNAGNANAATGKPGVTDAMSCMQEAARLLGCDPEEVLPSSTGVIGRRLPVDKIRSALPDLVGRLERGESADRAAAEAILTTDLVAKTAHREIEIEGKPVHLGAIAKGSGMIAPRLDSTPQATMLAFITTDAAVHGPALQRALEAASDRSFNRITVDAHASCSDTAVVMASGAAPIARINTGDAAYHVFASALTSLCEELAERIIRDGEGATRIFRIEVRGARTDAEAARMARAVADSPLVKCAVHGKDPNWGRIVTAAGNAGAPFDPEKSSLSIGGVTVYRAGVPTSVPPDDPTLVEAMGADPVRMTFTVDEGPGSAWVLGCDLSAEYVKINALYTT